MTSTPLFTIPIPPLGAHPGGAIVATEPAPAVYLLTITSPPDNRLTTASCTAMLDALDRVEFGGYTPGVVVTTSGIDKFYSNGLDLEHALGTEGFLPGVLYKLFNRFLTYPMPTIALLPGHAFAGGLMLAMHHDYRVMNPTKGFACINELDFGVPLKAPMSSIFRLKVPAATYRALVLEAHRFGGAEAVEAGIADRLGGIEAVLALVQERKLTGKAKTGIYGLLKAEMYRESVALLSREGYEEGEVRDRALAEGDERRREEGGRRVAGLRGEGGAKL
ncbi:ClpP/crotonase-like domain-containing protein [Parachaetomium inaequale]|uniref:ClpP/crotonase-like domain-containing protein n=1 Tax=Parachaetomium inaequale TaxID=2588326 RepID=A0AAN6PPT8_9PEZI|nr:ClpP/crotonase-like domain-containing protein [Parachaetomium inaequale]